MENQEVRATYNGKPIWFIDALTLINICTDNQILYKDDSGLIPIWHENSDIPMLYDVHVLASELMYDQEGVDCLTEELAKKGITFTPMDKSFFK